MPYYYTRICPICRKADVQDISRHLSQAHSLSSLNRKPYLEESRYQLHNESNVRTNNVVKMLDKSKCISGKAHILETRSLPQ